MTDNTRAELRRVVDALVRRSLCDDVTNVYIVSNGSDDDQMYIVTSFKSDESVALPPLTPAQQLALSVLLGEPDTVIQSALADMLMDMGHEYATAVAERARAEERLRCLRVVLDSAGATCRDELETDTIPVYADVASAYDCIANPTD